MLDRPEMPGYLHSWERILSPQEWIGKNRGALKNAVACLSDLLTREKLPPDARVVEVGPVSMWWRSDPTLALGHVPPIRALQKKHPDLTCATIGTQKISPKEKKQMLGDIPYVHGILDPHACQEHPRELLKALGGNPHLIYGQHVFENSPGCMNYLAFGPEKLFEKSAEILEPGGLLVVDNMGGQERQIGAVLDNFGLPWSQQMTPDTAYQYDRHEAIFVFRKTLSTPLK